MSSPYETLGVQATADSETIRQAYIRAARRHHPDRLAGASETERRAAADRMAEVNAAWAAVRTPEARARLDGRPDEGGHATVRAPGDTFRPLDEDEIADIDLDDTPSGARTIGRAVLLVPAALASSGVLALMIGLIVGLGPLAGLGLGLIVAGAVSFVLVPVFAMVRSSQAELAAEHRRRT